MSRKYSSSWNYAANYDVQIARPLDNRLVLESTLDLISKDTFGENAKFAYEGMIVAVVNDGVYYLKNLTTLQSFIYNNIITVATYDTLSAAGWEKIEGKATTDAEVLTLSTEFYENLNNNYNSLFTHTNQVSAQLNALISDNFTTLSSNLKILSSDVDTLSTDLNLLEKNHTEQINIISTNIDYLSTSIQTTSSIIDAKIDTNVSNIYDKINQITDEIKNDLTGVYVYKGTKATYDDLPTEGNNIGDVWNVEAAYGDVPAGTNYAWNGTDWEVVGGIVDLRPIENKTSLVVGTYKLNESVNISHLNNISLICIDDIGNHTNYYQIQSEECFKEVIAGDNNAFELDIADAGLLTVHATNSGYYQINGF